MQLRERDSNKSTDLQGAVVKGIEDLNVISRLQGFVVIDPSEFGSRFS